MKVASKTSPFGEQPMKSAFVAKSSLVFLVAGLKF